MLVSPAVPPKSNKISLSGGAAPPEKLFLRKSGGAFSELDRDPGIFLTIIVGIFPFFC